MKLFIDTGQCLWCGKTINEGAIFKNIPHILPKSIGGTETCVDVCDDCNSYFGKATSKERLSCDHTVKEVLQICRLFLLGRDSKYKFSSTLFHIDSQAGKIKLKPNCTFSSRQITRQFKRGICEAVMQKYHLLSGNGNEDRFDKVRRFTRYDEGDITFLYTLNKVVIALREPISPSIMMGEEDIKKIDEYGMFTLHIYGLILMVDLVPDTPLSTKQQYVNNTSNTLFSKELTYRMDVLNDINELDIFYSRFHNFRLALDEKNNVIIPSLRRPN